MRITRKKRAGYFFSLPAFLFMIALMGFPILYNWIISFQSMTIRSFNAGTVKFNGLENYMEVLGDSNFWNAFGNTFLYTIVCIVFQFVIGFLLALLFNQKFKAARPMRGLLVISYILPMTVVALMFKYIFSDSGIVNYILTSLNLIKRFQRSSAYQSAVDVRLSKQLRSRLCIYGSAVLNTDLRRCLFIIDLRDAVTDSLTYFLSLLGGSGFSGSNSPDRLVSDHCFLCLLCGHILKSDLYLLADEIHRHALLSLLKRFSAAHNRCDAVLERFQHLFVYALGCLSKVLSPLGVSEHHIFYACVGQHRRRNLTCIGSFLLEIHVFSAYLNVASLCSLNNRKNVDGRNAEHYVHFLVVYQRFQCVYQFHSLAGSHIHLPVSSNNFLSCHDSLPLYLSFAAATPGSSFPSRNSRDAPPPVEICVILSP